LRKDASGLAVGVGGRVDDLEKHMRNYALLATGAIAVAGISLAGATDAEARKHRHHHRGVSVIIGAPLMYGGHYYGAPRYGYGPSYRAYGPECLRWQRYYTRSGKERWRCVVW